VSATKIHNSLLQRSSKTVNAQAKRKTQKRAKQSKRDRKIRKRKGRGVYGAGERESKGGRAGQSVAGVHFKDHVESSDVEQHSSKWILWI
jgi:hypothetical protein